MSHLKKYSCKMMNQPPQVAPHDDSEKEHFDLGIILTTGIKVISQLVPDWQPPMLGHPYAKPYASALKMLDDITAGDQIMVKNTSGYWHHGIYVGKQTMVDREGHSESLNAVVDFWGEDKKRARITIRPYSDFADGAVGWAKAQYPDGVALEQSLSAQLAIAWVSYAEEHHVPYNIILHNCEIFATVCRCIRSESAIECHYVLRMNLARMHVPVVKPLRKLCLLHAGKNLIRST